MDRISKDISVLNFTDVSLQTFVNEVNPIRENPLKYFMKKCYLHVKNIVLR